jgi:hypothetical protein
MRPRLPAAFTGASCLAYSPTLKMDVICYSEKSVDFEDAALRDIPEEKIF